MLSNEYAPRIRVRMLVDSIYSRAKSFAQQADAGTSVELSAFADTCKALQERSVEHWPELSAAVAHLVELLTSAPKDDRFPVAELRNRAEHLIRQAHAD